MGVKYWKPGGPMLLVLPNVTALLLLAGAFLILNWPPVSIRASSAIKISREDHVELLEKSKNCSRPCIDGERPKECHYKLVLEPFLTFGRGCYKCALNETDCQHRHCVSADGIQRTMLSVNRQLPGTPIYVCEGDMVVVDVENHLPGLETSLHWHGQLQRGTPYMDGVPMITQCPIVSDTRFEYKFRASTPGTHFYHSHYVSHHADGIFGPLIVRQQPHMEPNSEFYDYDEDEHVITISPWTHSVLSYNLDFQEDIKISSLLINGLGNNYNEQTAAAIPAVKFSIKWGNRYRFRIINSASLDCPVHFQVEKHKLTVIATDGMPVKSVAASHLVLFPGERYDVVLSADQPVSSYWVQIRGHHKCANLHQEAVILYDGATLLDSQTENSQAALQDLSTLMMKTCLDISHKTCRSHKTMLRSTGREQHRELQTPQADVKLFMPFDVYSYDNYDDNDVNFDFTLDDAPYYPSYLYNGKRPIKLPQLDRIAFAYPPSPLISQPENVPQGMKCGQKCKKRDKFCECLHVVYIPVNVSADIILVDEGRGGNNSNTFHLHGYSFLVLGSSSLGRPVELSEIKSLDSKGKLHRNLIDPPRKDTVVVPNKGYVILRLFTDNPGFWLFEARSTSPVMGGGMQFVLQVGDKTSLPPVPSNFPHCGILKGPNFIF